MKAYSHDLRERVVHAIDQGKSQIEVSHLFEVSTSTIKRYLRQRREVGHIHQKKIPGRSPAKQAAVQASLLAQLEAHPDATLQEHCDIWKEQSGIQVSIMTISRAIDSIGWTRKKNARSK